MEQQLCSAVDLLSLVKGLHKNSRLKVKVHSIEINAFKRSCCTHGARKATHPKITVVCFLEAKSIHLWRITRHFFQVKLYTCTLHRDSMTIQIITRFFLAKCGKDVCVLFFRQVFSGTLLLEMVFIWHTDIFIPISDG